MKPKMLSPDDPAAGGGGTPPVVVPPAAGVTPADPVAAFRKEFNDKSAELRHETKALREELAGVKGVKDELKAFLAKFGGGGGGETTTTTTTPVTPAAPVTTTDGEAMRELAFRDAMDEAGISDVKQRKGLRRLFTAEKPTDLGVWLPGAVEMIGGKAIHPVVPKVVGPAAPSTDTGAPAAATGLQLPDNPMEWPQSYVDSLTPAEAKTKWDAYVAKKGGFVHPFAAGKAAARTGGDSDALIQKLAAALKK